MQLWFLISTLVFPALTRIIYFADVLIKDVISQAMKDVNQNTFPNSMNIATQFKDIFSVLINIHISYFIDSHKHISFDDNIIFENVEQRLTY